MSRDGEFFPISPHSAPLQAGVSILGAVPLYADPTMTSPPSAMELTRPSLQSPRAPPAGTAASTSTIAYLSVAFALVALILRRLRRGLRPFHHSTGLPPCSIPPHPIWGHMKRVFAPPEDPKFASVFVDQADPSSGISSFWMIHVPCVGVVKAEHARIVLRSSVERRNLKILSRHFIKSLGQDSIVMMDARDSNREKWRQHRNLMKTAFTAHAVEDMAGKVWKVANGFASSILRECEKDRNGRGGGSYRADASELFKWATLDVFGAVALDYRFGCTENLAVTPLAHSINHTVEDSNERCKALLNPALQLYWLPTRRNRDFNWHSNNVNCLMRDMCQERMGEIRNGNRRASHTLHNSLKRDMVRDDLLTALLRSKALLDGADQDESHDGLIKMLMTLFFAGFDTSSVLLSMAMYVAAKNPEIQQECARESREASTTTLPSKDGKFCTLHEDVTQWESRLAYCRAIILETLRLHPPAYTNSRNLSKDIVLDGCTIPKGTRVFLPILQIHTDLRNFARPTEFLPERWVRRDDNTGRWVARDYTAEPRFVKGEVDYVPPANPHHLFTFSDGARKCVGHRLAMQESTILFACLLRDLAVDVEEGFEVQKRKKFALAIPEELPLIFTRRKWDSQR